MQWIIDNLAAFIIGCTVVLILFVLQSRGQEAAIEAIQFNTAKNDIHTAVAIMEQDIANAGAGLLLPNDADPNKGVNIQVDTTATGANYRYLRFRGRSDRYAQTVECIEYRWRRDGTVTLQSGVATDTYQIERGTNPICPVPPGNFVAATSNTVTEFKVTLRDDQLTPIYSLDPLALNSTRRIDLRFRLVSTLERTEYAGVATNGETEMMEETRWARQIRPLNLQREDKSLLLSP